MVQKEEWNGFEGRLWREEVNVRDFIQNNYTPYDGDKSFLAGPTEATNKLWGKLQELQAEERKKGGVLDMDTDIVSGITSHKPGYISEDLKGLEAVVALFFVKRNNYFAVTLCLEVVFSGKLLSYFLMIVDFTVNGKNYFSVVAYKRLLSAERLRACTRHGCSRRSVQCTRDGRR